MTHRYLIVTYSYAPMPNARAFRWTALAERWAARGDQVDVVCGWEPGMAHTETRNGVNLHRVNAQWIERLRRRFSNKPAEGNTPPENALSMSNGTRLKTGLRTVLRWLYYNVYKQLYWPDMAYLWYFPARACARRLMRQTAYDALISVSFQFTAHLVGLRLHHLFPKVCWLVDVGDPFWLAEFDPPNNQVLYGRLNRNIERAVLREARRISVTTELTRDHYIQNFPETAGRITVIPPLLSLATPPASAATSRTDDRIRLVFAGMLYATLRRPDHLLRLFADLIKRPGGDRLELHFWGFLTGVRGDFEPYQALLDRQIFLHGQVPRDQAAQALRDADILINIGNKVPFQLPSKVVEYVSLNKPILNLATIETDSSSVFFKNYPAALTLFNRDGADFCTQADQLYEFVMHPPPPLTREAIMTLLAPYQIDAISAAYEQWLADGCAIDS